MGSVPILPWYSSEQYQKLLPDVVKQQTAFVHFTQYYYKKHMEVAKVLSSNMIIL